MADYADPVREALRRAGCRFDRYGKGDHEIWPKLATADRRRQSDQVAPYRQRDPKASRLAEPKQF